MNLLSFRSDNWKYLEPDAKLSRLQELENYAAESQGRMPRTVVTSQDLGDNVLGEYDPRRPDCIFISEDHLNSDAEDASYRLMETCLHEGRHAYQDDACRGRMWDGKASDEEVEIWRKNGYRGVYINDEFPLHEENPYSNYISYYNQPVEYDAEDYAMKMMNGFSDTLSDDPVFVECMKNMNDNRNDLLREAEAIYGENYKEELADIIEERYNNKYGTEQSNSVHDNNENNNNTQDVTEGDSPHITYGGKFFNDPNEGTHGDETDDVGENEATDKTNENDSSGIVYGGKFFNEPKKENDAREKDKSNENDGIEYLDFSPNSESAPENGENQRDNAKSNDKFDFLYSDTGKSNGENESSNTRQNNNTDTKPDEQNEDTQNRQSNIENTL